MGMINQLITYWEEQGISIQPRDIIEVENFVKLKRLQLPLDFLTFYTKVNGMVNLYPNDYDKEGFLFYPLEYLVDSRDKFSKNSTLSDSKIIIFGDYLLRCWWYGVRVINHRDYEIIKISNEHAYHVITNSLSDFLGLYLANDDRIY